jgi:hypothetical protein
MPRKKKEKIRRTKDPLYRPYDPDFHPEDLKTRMGQGELNVQIYPTWGITEKTFYCWVKEHEELNEAYELGKGLYEKWFVENRFNPMIEGRLQGKHSFNASIAIANNKLGWVKGTEGERKVHNTQINVNSLTVNNNSTPQELIESIKKNVEYLSDTKIIEAEIVELPNNENRSDRKD